MTSRRFLGLRGHEVRILGWTFLATLLAKGAVFYHAYSKDDYELYLQPVAPELLLGQGRFGQYLLMKFFYLIGPGPPHTTIVAPFVLLLATALLSTLIVRHWGVAREQSLAVFAACMIATHPFTTSILVFRYNNLVTAMAFTLMAVILLYRRRSTIRLLLQALLFAAALSIYQGILNYALMIVLTGCVISMVRYLMIDGKLSASRKARGLLEPSRLFRHRNTQLLLVVMLGTLVYMVSNRVFFMVSGVAADKRSRFISFDDVGHRIDQIARSLKIDFIHSHKLIPVFALRLLLVMAALGLIALLWHLFVARGRFREAFRWHRVLPVGVLFLAAAAAVVWTVGTNMVLDIWHVPPRVKAHTGVLWACSLVVSVHTLGRQGRRLVLGIAAIAIASFISVSNGILSDQIRLNTRDRLLANRVVARLEMSPEFSQVEVVAIPTYWDRGFKYEVWLQTDREGGAPAFSVEWAKVNILREISGYDLKPAGLADMKRAKRYCRNAEVWPAESSVAIKGRLAIVCMTEPKRPKRAPEAGRPVPK